MNGEVIGVSTLLSEGKIVWNADLNTGYDIAPSVIIEKSGVVYVPTDKGIIYAIERETGNLLWKHRISACLVNQIFPIDKQTVICTSMDGIVTKLKAE